ncbi:hypothetical protein VTH06DRAFT_5158 [Thermothelomyces fergusii]
MLPNAAAPRDPPENSRPLQIWASRHVGGVESSSAASGYRRLSSVSASNTVVLHTRPTASSLDATFCVVMAS